LGACVFARLGVLVGQSRARTGISAHADRRSRRPNLSLAAEGAPRTTRRPAAGCGWRTGCNMTATARRLFGQLFTGPNYRSSIVLATSALCLVAWHNAGTYQFWHDNLPARLAMCGDLRVSSAVAAFVSSVVLLGLAPLLVVKGVLRERAADYGIAWGNVRFAAVCCALVFRWWW